MQNHYKSSALSGNAGAWMSNFLDQYDVLLKPASKPGQPQQYARAQTAGPNYSSYHKQTCLTQSRGKPNSSSNQSL
jgi:hypothetical protein